MNKTIVTNDKNEGGSIFKALMKGMAISYAITTIIFIMYAIILTYTDITEKSLTTVVMGTVVLATIISGFDTARAAEKRGLIWGVIAGIIYAVIMVLIGVCIMPIIQFGTKTIMIIVLSAAGGGLGGIVGINTKRKGKSKF